jgi:hypothetical protein
MVLPFVERNKSQGGEFDLGCQLPDSPSWLAAKSFGAAVAYHAAAFSFGD